MKHVRKAALAACAFSFAAISSPDWSVIDGLSLSVASAEARVGRPLTPVSVAGVSRRHARRAAYGYGVVGAGAAAVGTAAVISATAPYQGWGNSAWTNSYAAQTDPRFGEPNYAHRAYYRQSPYYGYNGWDDYSGRNFIRCAPGSLTKLDDGRMYTCQ